MDACHPSLEVNRFARTHPEVCWRPGMDGFYHFEDRPCQKGHVLRWPAEWELPETFGVEVLGGVG